MIGLSADQGGMRMEKQRILLAEDDWSFASAIRDILHMWNYEVAGPFQTLDEALKAARGEALSGALLDINLGADHVYPLADYLAGKGTPFLLMSGLGDRIPVERRPGWRCLDKTKLVVKLEEELVSLLGNTSARP